MANQNGHCMEFEFMEAPGVPRIAKLSKTWINLDIQGGLFTAVHDSEWETLIPGVGWNGPWEKLRIHGTDGNPWDIKPHGTKSTFGNRIKVWITSHDPNNSGSENTNFEIVDWQGGKWKVVIDNEVDNNTSPGFTLTQI